MGRIVVPRRDVLKGLGAAAGLAACGPDPLAPGRSGVRGPGRIDTIVICMMENRSFDHVFGSLSLLEGRTDIDGLVAGMSNPDLDGVEIPINPSVAPCVDPDPPHGWDTSRVQLDGGANRGFVKAYLQSNGLSAPPSFPMSYQTRATLPVTYALADRYAICQNWYSSVLTSTWPNRLYFHAAQSLGVDSNDLPSGGYKCRTIWDQLTDAGIDWAYYFTDLPTLALFTNPNFAGHLLFIDQFHADAAAGNLPPVVCVDAGAGFNDDHPPHHPMLGQLFIGSIYQSLAASPHWPTSMFMVTYDEAGGFFDHVAPGTMDDDYASTGFDQLGFRVPAFAAGPYVKNTVSSTRFDHTAALTFIQNQFGITERLTKRNEASARDADLAELLDLDALAAGTPADPIELPVIEASEEEIEAECASLGNRTGQPELRAHVRSWDRALDRTEQLPDIARASWRLAYDQGLWVPR
ncbi:MAG: alkaline phosphatase family protein [Myxococcota bacterium]